MKLKNSQIVVGYIVEVATSNNTLYANGLGGTNEPNNATIFETRKEAQEEVRAWRGWRDYYFPENAKVSIFLVERTTKRCS